MNEDIILSMFCNGTSYNNDQITGFVQFPSCKGSSELWAQPNSKNTEIQ